jgi:cell division septum initiation protein DivIVA
MRAPERSVGRKSPHTDGHRPIRIETVSTAAEGTATARDGVFAPPSATAGRKAASRRLNTGDVRPFALRLNADLGLASFTATTALQCARLDLLAGDLPMAAAELRRAYGVLASSEESHLLPPLSELPAELLHAWGRGDETREIRRAADGLTASDAVALRALWPSVPRSDLDWREQADEAEWRAGAALELVRLGAAMGRVSSLPAQSAGGDGEPRSAERCAWQARRAVAPAPGLARQGVLREILANDNLPDRHARALALELLEVPDELWTTIDPLNDGCWWYRSRAPRRPAVIGSSPEMRIGPRRSGIRHTRSVAEDKASEAGEKQNMLPPLEEGGGAPQLRTQVPAAIRNVSFPGAARGYERRAVDTYVKEVNRLIAELEVGRSPEAAVKHALDRVGEQTKALLQQARETAEEITASAREEAEVEVTRAKAEAEEISARANAAGAEAEEIVGGAKAEAGKIVTGAKAEAAETVTGAKTEADNMIAAAKTDADDLVARAHAEAEELLARSRAEAAERRQRLDEEIGSAREQAEARMQELHAETEAVWKERHELLDEMHVMGTRLLEVASTAAARVSATEVSEEATPEVAPAAEAESAQA